MSKPLLATSLPTLLSNRVSSPYLAAYPRPPSRSTGGGGALPVLSSARRAPVRAFRFGGEDDEVNLPGMIESASVPVPRAAPPRRLSALVSEGGAVSTVSAEPVRALDGIVAREIARRRSIVEMARERRRLSIEESDTEEEEAAPAPRREEAPSAEARERGKAAAKEAAKAARKKANEADVARVKEKVAKVKAKMAEEKAAKEKPRKGKMTWVAALKIYNASHGKWCVPRKGTAEHAEVRKIQLGE